MTHLNSLGRVLSVNVGIPREFTWLGRAGESSIWKAPVDGRVRLGGVNVLGDDQADRSVHGGPDRAVYAYAREDQSWWAERLGRELDPGAFGENLTLTGVPVTDAAIGERWHIGTAVLEVSSPRVPCWKLGARIEDAGFPRMFAEAGRPGAYLRIAEAGEVGAGDDVRVIHRPDRRVTVGDVSRIYHRHHADARLLEDLPALAAYWHMWVAKQLRRQTSAKAQPRVLTPEVHEARRDDFLSDKL